MLLDEQERVQSTAELTMEEGSVAAPLTVEESFDGLSAPLTEGNANDQRCSMM